ncbi:MAG: divalent cation tolerance protein CutA [Proteobacteria bacterium]|nr:divalent cation tolerance protein CutA [Pseudomonadota bacterium]MBU1716564.1 divalent cation tolerance protein CutA [Pseudomonadota bacterium]
MTANKEDAERMALDVVAQKLAACTQVEGPITSFYIWQGKQERSEEYRITFKFLAANGEAMELWIKENHPYECPQWITVEAARVSNSYFEWAMEVSGKKEVLPEEGESAIELSKQGTQLLKSKDFQGAERVLLRAYELDSKNAYILVGLGDLYRERRHFKKAIGYYAMILELDAENVFALRGIGDAHRGLNEHEEAISYWKRYLECNKDDLQVMTRVGDSYKKIKKISDSEKYYKMALSVRENDKYALLGIGSLFYKAEKDEEALHYLEKLLALDDSYVAVLTMVGNVYRRRKEYEKAIVYYEKAAAQEPWNTFALYGLGDCHRWMQNYEDVIVWWLKILEKEPKNQVMHSRLGDAYFNIGDLENAKNHYSKSLEIRFDPYALIGLSRIFRSLDLYDDAEDCCRQVLEQSPYHARAKEELETIYNLKK